LKLFKKYYLLIQSEKKKIYYSVKILGIEILAKGNLII